MKPRISYTKPSITNLEVGYTTDAAAHGWGSECYDYLHKFEKLFRNHVGSRFSVATSSCTGALQLGIAALGIGHGDEIIMADTNWIASASPFVHAGAVPVFVDILEDTWCIDPKKAEAAITPRTRAIIAPHLYGNLCDMNELQSIGRKYGIHIIEDAAEAIGARYFGKVAGSMGTFGVFSFHGTKTITTGEGGMLVTNDPEIYEKAGILNNHGRTAEQPKDFWPETVGFKFKMSNVQAAMGCGQMERVDVLIKRKRSIFDQYFNKLSKYSDVTMNAEREGTVIGAWMPTVVFSERSGVKREHILAAFKSENIDARSFFWPLSGLPMFADARENTNAWSIPERAINLPSYHDIDEAAIERVTEVIVKLLES